MDRKGLNKKKYSLLTSAAFEFEPYIKIVAGQGQQLHEIKCVNRKNNRKTTNQSFKKIQCWVPPLI